MQFINVLAQITFTLHALLLHRPSNPVRAFLRRRGYCPWLFYSAGAQAAAEKVSRSLERTPCLRPTFRATIPHCGKGMHQSKVINPGFQRNRCLVLMAFLSIISLTISIFWAAKAESSPSHALWSPVGAISAIYLRQPW